MKPDKLFVNML